MAEGKGLAVVTGASSGIGFELARCCAEAGYDLVIAADEEAIVTAAEELAGLGVSVTPVTADLAMPVEGWATPFSIRRSPISAASSTPISPARCCWSTASAGTCGRAIAAASC